MDIQAGYDEYYPEQILYPIPFMTGDLLSKSKPGTSRRGWEVRCWLIFHKISSPSGSSSGLAGAMTSIILNRFYIPSPL